MNTRVNPFANLEDVPVFEPKPKKLTPVAPEVVERISEDNKFPSRQAPKPAKEARRKGRKYTTGRNQQFNLKAKGVTIERFHKLAHDRKVALGALLELALDALERAGGSATE